MRDLNRYLKYAADWKDIGIQLGLEFNMLNNIARNNFQQAEYCVQEVLDKWLKVDPKATWKSLEVALTNVRRLQLGLDPVDDVYISKDSNSEFSL